MKNISKLALLILLFNCIMCLSAKAQEGGFLERVERMRQQKKEEIERLEQIEIEKEKQKKECIQIGLIIGGIFAVPMLIVSTTLIISTIKGKRHERH